MLNTALQIAVVPKDDSAEALVQPAAMPDPLKGTNVEMVGGMVTTIPGTDIPDRPSPQWVRGTCPLCGDALVSNCYYVGGRGYLIVWECWAGVTAMLRGTDKLACSFRKVL